MPETTALHAISNHEFRVIARLLRAHVDEYSDRVKAMVAFGDLITQGDTFDIDLLEVVSDWKEKRFGRFSRSEKLPLRGELRLYILTPQELEDPSVISDPKERQWVVELLEQVRRGFEVVMETPLGWTQQKLDGHRDLAVIAPPPSGTMDAEDPFTLTRQGK